MHPDPLTGIFAAIGLSAATDGATVPIVVIVVIGLACLYLLIKAGKFLLKLFLFLLAAALFTAAYWWHLHR